MHICIEQLLLKREVRESLWWKEMEEWNAAILKKKRKKNEISFLKQLEGKKVS